MVTAEALRETGMSSQPLMQEAVIKSTDPKCAAISALRRKEAMPHEDPLWGFVNSDINLAFKAVNDRLSYLAKATVFLPFYKNLRFEELSWQAKKTDEESPVTALVGHDPRIKGKVPIDRASAVIIATQEGPKEPLFLDFAGVDERNKRAVCGSHDIRNDRINNIKNKGILTELGVSISANEYQAIQRELGPDIAEKIITPIANSKDSPHGDTSLITEAMHSYLNKLITSGHDLGWWPTNERHAEVGMKMRHDNMATLRLPDDLDDRSQVSPSLDNCCCCPGINNGNINIGQLNFEIANGMLGISWQRDESKTLPKRSQPQRLFSLQ